ncbi:hypothetical protein [Frondihabitans peucedani]|uniref:hypothetical protein n=1 Tax=Frondihabitans peucedani TaxID=598626 RepID=UPI003CD0BE9C
MLVLWIWILNLAVLFGAEIDTETLRARQLREGLPSEKNLQLPLRDDRGIRKREQQKADVIHDGEQLRNRPAPHERVGGRSGP